MKSVRDRGSATFMALTAAMVLFGAAVLVTVYGAAALARNRAAAAADLAALAAAARLWSTDPGAPCRAARKVAGENHASVTRCLTTNGVADISTEVRLVGTLSRLGHADARARAVPGFPALPGALAAGNPSDLAAESMGPDGLTARTRRVRDLVREQFGERNIGGYCPGGCRSGHIPGSDHYTGHAIDIMILPYSDPARVAQGQRIATWLVAAARPLAVKYVIYRARIWTPDRGWRAYQHPYGPSTNPTLLHMDHVHVSVF